MLPDAQETRERALPHSLEAERSVLGGVLLDAEVLHELEDQLHPEDFYRRAHGVIWEAMTALSAESKPVDLVTLVERLRDHDQLDACGGLDYLANLDTGVPTASHAVTYAGIVKEKATLRRLIGSLNGALTEAVAGPSSIRDFIDQVEGDVFKISQSQEKRDLAHAGEVALDVFKILEARFAAQSDVTGVSTGYTDLDRITAGLQRGDLIILAARPSMGKTALALNIASNAALRLEPGAAVAVFSLEMPREQLVMRMLASEGRVPSETLRTGRIAQGSWPKLATAASKLNDSKLYIDDTPALTLNALRSKCRRMRAKHGLDLVVIDYLQLMRGPKTDSREQEISAISRGLKQLAKELEVPVMALSQLNRSLERRENKRPQLSDLRESGAIEQDADVIAFIHREDRYKQGENAEHDGLAEVIIAKQRNGPVDTVELVFFESYTRFDNYERREGVP